MSELRNLIATRYLTPLREGGSLPAVVEADDGELYVMKFLGAGQGAEALSSSLARSHASWDCACPRSCF